MARKRILYKNGHPITADQDVLMAVADDAPQILDEITGITDDDGRVVCPVPFVEHEVQEIMARETDAREYGLQRPVSHREILAWRVLRAERSAADADRRRSRRKGD